MRIPLRHFFHLFLALSCFAIRPLCAQQVAFTGEKKAVYLTVLQVFDGMRENDSAKVHAAFRNDVMILTSYTKKSGEEVLEKDDFQGFLTAVGKPHAVAWDERLRNTKIEVDGNLAQVWTEYGFYAGDRFSHCGVDAFLLVKEQGKWRIIQLADTRKFSGCDWAK